MEKINNSLSSFASGEEKDEKLTKDDKYDIPVRFSDENLPDDWEEVGIRMSNVSEKKPKKHQMIWKNQTQNYQTIRKT